MDSTFTQRELDDLRTAVLGTFDKTCTIRKVANASDSQGGMTETWSDRSTNVPCRLTRSLTRGETNVADRMMHVGNYTLAIPWGETIEPTDKVIVDSLTYDVIEVISGCQVVQKVYLELKE